MKHIALAITLIAASVETNAATGDALLTCGGTLYDVVLAGVKMEPLHDQKVDVVFNPKTGTLSVPDATFTEMRTDKGMVQWGKFAARATPEGFATLDLVGGSLVYKLPGQRGDYKLTFTGECNLAKLKF